MRRTAALALALVLLLMSTGALAARFVYEGHLEDLGQPANGRYDLRLSVYGGATQGTPLAAPVTVDGIEVKEGRFRLAVELPLVESDQVWLEVAMRANGEPAFVSIPGRTKAIAAPLIGACWSTTGDSGSNPATNFIGTTDAQPFVVRTGNATSLRIEPSTALFGGLPITTNTVAGSRANSVIDGVRGATISGGGVPTGTSDPDFFNENPNRVAGHYGTVAGGFGNIAGLTTVSPISSAFATVGGGRENTASGQLSTIAGGSENTASDFWSTVGGGSVNTASGERSTVVGGSLNTAGGNFSTVSGGVNNCAGGAFSWAGGSRAKVRPGTDPGGTGPCSGLSYPGGSGDQGTFVWADSLAPSFVSTDDNQFLIRASGGIGFNTNEPRTAFDLVANRDGHAMLVQNDEATTADGIAIRVNESTPTTSNNFLSFQRGAGTNVGSVEGNSAGGVVFNTSGGDYAEYLPLAPGVPKALLPPGRVVAVRDGAVSLDTTGAQQLGVVSTNPAVSGNDPGEAKRDSHALIAFLGQVEVAVTGPVSAGDFLIPSGRGDGRAMAAAPTALATELIGAVIGRAWTASADDEGTVRALVGLNPADAAQSAALARLAEENARLRSESLNLHQRLERVEALLGKPPAERR
jgi:hypothetical protein